MALFQVMHEVSLAAQSEESRACLIAGKSCGGVVPQARSRRCCSSAQPCKVTIATCVEAVVALLSLRQGDSRSRIPSTRITYQKPEGCHFPLLGAGVSDEAHVQLNAARSAGRSFGRWLRL